MAKKKIKSVVFEPSTEVLTAEISVKRKEALDVGTERGSLSGTLHFANKVLELDLSNYRKMSLENWRIVARGLTALVKEAEDALEAL